MAEALRVGLIGLDTSHCVAFSRLLNAADAPHHIPGARVVAAFPGGTPGWDKSEGRVEQFTQQVRDEFGVEIVASPEEVGQASDLVIITAVDGRAHRGLFEKVADYGKPVFIDKPFATSTDDALAILHLAKDKAVPMMSASALRYAEAFTKQLGDDALGPVTGIDVFGPMALDDALTGLFWYGCHGIEMVVAAMGPGCVRVQAASHPRSDVVTMTWADGRMATYRGLREAHGKFGATIHRTEGFQTVDVGAGAVPFYASLLEAVLGSLPGGGSDVPPAEMFEVVRLMEAGNTARDTGETVELNPVTVPGA